MMAELAAALRAARVGAGVSLARLAELTSYSKPYLGQLETGVRGVRPEHVDAYERALGVRIADAVEDALTELRPMLQPAAESLRGRMEFTDREIEAARRLAEWARARQWNDATPALGPVEDWLRLNMTRLDRGTRAREALRAGAELAHLAGTMHWDVEDHGRARQRFTLAAKFAHAAGDDELIAGALGGLAYLYLDIGQPGDALEVVQFAQYLVRRSADPRLQSALIGWEGLAYSMIGDGRAFERCVMLASEYAADDDHAPPSTPAQRCLETAQLAGVVGPRRTWPSPHEQYRHVGAAFRNLIATRPRYSGHLHDNLASILDRAGDSVADRELFDLINCSRVYLAMGEPARAAECVARVLPMADSWTAGRAAARLRDIHHESAEFAALSEIRDARAAIAESVR
ncbi:helix-turn-helix transcriptional regulator [Nocardia sp. NPDC051030]|uniref:helix-turn-helix domain-containing protein n=1 Tax=Nocardia sp. NPDC051030 TaxID=3155162 RepID=UPI0034475005